MNRTLPLIVSLVSTVLASPAARARAEADTKASRRPNVLFLISDDMRTDLGCYGNPRVKTPNIDALAARGVRFERAYVQYPLCNPSRSSMLTGRYPTATGVMDNRSYFGDAHPELVSLPRFFKAQGYATLRSGKVFHEGIDDADAWTEGASRAATARHRHRTPPGRRPKRRRNPRPPRSGSGAWRSGGSRTGSSSSRATARRTPMARPPIERSIIYADILTPAWRMGR